MKKLYLLSFILLGACSSLGPHVEYLYEGPHGAVYEAYCDGSSTTIGKCYQLAAQTCNGNFKIMDKGQNSQKTRVYNHFSATNTAVDQYTMTKRYMIFYCQY